MERANCQCCGYPTLDRKGYDEICLLCDWQDDSKEEEFAKDVLGGPNRDYSLEEARNNFNSFFSMYRENELDETEWCVLDEKRNVMAAYDSLNNADNKCEEEKWGVIVNLEERLYVKKFNH